MGAVIRAGICLFIAVSLPLAARAQSAPDAEDDSRAGDTAENELARLEFESGVAAAERSDWREAARLFESSMARSPRVATAFDLVVAYGHLDEPLALARTADRLTALADPERHRALLEVVAPLRERALRAIAMIDLLVEPPGARVRLDGERELEIEERLPCYVAPGSHTLEVRAEGYVPRSLELSAEAGERLELRVALEREAVVPPTPPIESTGTLENGRLEANTTLDSVSLATSSPSPPLTAEVDTGDTRRVAAISHWALGVASWIASAIVEATAWADGDRVATADPTMPGFLSQVASYEERATAAVVLSVLGGALGSAGDFAWPWQATDEDEALWTAAVGAVCVVGGLVLFIRSPEPLGETRVHDSGRAIGALLFSAGVPLALAPLSFWIEGTPSRSGPSDRGVSGGFSASGAF